MNGDNVTMDTKQEAYREALATQNEVDQAKQVHDQAVGRHRAVLKKWKKEGVDPDHVTYALKSRHDEDVVADERGKLAMVGIAHKMPDIHRHIFPDLFAAEPDTSLEGEGAIAEAYDGGFHAGQTGRSRDTNPFEVGTAGAVKWQEGWLAGQRFLAEEMVESQPPTGDEEDIPGTDANGSYVQQLRDEDSHNEDIEGLAAYGEQQHDAEEAGAAAAKTGPTPRRKRGTSKKRTASELFGADTA
jgi:ribosome modulation factor